MEAFLNRIRRTVPGSVLDAATGPLRVAGTSALPLARVAAGRAMSEASGGGTNRFDANNGGVLRADRCVLC